MALGVALELALDIAGQQILCVGLGRALGLALDNALSVAIRDALRVALGVALELALDIAGCEITVSCAWTGTRRST